MTLFNHPSASAPRHQFVAVGGHELHVTEWGDPTNPALVMWHGLARTGRDFDELAAAFAEHWFVVCPDTIGRGLSSWSMAAAAEYSVSYYADLAIGLLDAYGVENAGWIGTSMGGLIGMWLASSADARRLNWLVINDIGPEVPADAIARILEYSQTPPVFATLQEAEAMLRAAYAPFGPASDAFWRRMAITSVRRREDGGWTTHFDPRITNMITTNSPELNTWDRWAQITLPVHVVGGASSDLLLRPIAERMAQEGPKPEVTWWEDCGHAPTLSRPGDIEIVQKIVADLNQRSRQR